MVLVVDDCNFNLCAVESLLLQFDVICDTCNDGMEAIDLVKARLESGEAMYKLILMDYSMPVCDGRTATSAILSMFKGNGNRLANQPFICCMTAYAEETYKDAALKAGMDHVIVKPFFKV